MAANLNGETLTQTEILLAFEICGRNFAAYCPSNSLLGHNQLIDIKLLSAEGAEAGLRLEDSEFSEPLAPSSVIMSLRPWTVEFPSHRAKVTSKNKCAPKLPAA